MKLLPFESIIYKTHLEPDYVLGLMERAIEPKRTFRINSLFGSGKFKDYEGKLNEDGSFDIRRIISYRNSFLPVIKGQIDQDFNGTQIKVKMRLHLVVLIFMMLWSVGVSLALVIALLFGIVGNEVHPISFIPLGMLLFGYAITMGGFKYESTKSKKFLAKLFDSESELN